MRRTLRLRGWRCGSCRKLFRYLCIASILLNNHYLMFCCKSVVCHLLHALSILFAAYCNDFPTPADKTPSNAWFLLERATRDARVWARDGRCVCCRVVGSQVGRMVMAAAGWRLYDDAWEASRGMRILLVVNSSVWGDVVGLILKTTHHNTTYHVPITGWYMVVRPSPLPCTMRCTLLASSAIPMRTSPAYDRPTNVASNAWWVMRHREALA